MFDRFKARRSPEVDVTELAQALERGAQVVDVRGDGEYRSGHVPGARLVPLREVSSRAAELKSLEPVYVICASGARSSRAAATLRSAGIEAFNVRGGTAAWARAGNRLERGA